MPRPSPSQAVFLVVLLLACLFAYDNARLRAVLAEKPKVEVKVVEVEAKSKLQAASRTVRVKVKKKDGTVEETTTTDRGPILTETVAAREEERKEEPAQLEECHRYAGFIFEPAYRGGSGNPLGPLRISGGRAGMTTRRLILGGWVKDQQVGDQRALAGGADLSFRF